MPFEGGNAVSLSVKAAPGTVLRNPLDGSRISDSIPAVVPNNTYWRRRVRAHDAMLVIEAVVEQQYVEAVQKSTDKLKS